MKKTASILAAGLLGFTLTAQADAGHTHPTDGLFRLVGGVAKETVTAPIKLTGLGLKATSTVTGAVSELSGEVGDTLLAVDKPKEREQVRRKDRR